MTRVITYTLTLEEPCLLAAPGGDPNTESSLAYIPGGALRGALAAVWLRDHKNADETFTDLFLNGKVRYLNAYPLLDTRALPVPRAWTKLKDEGDKDEDDKVYNRAEQGQFDKADESITSGVGATFVTFTAPYDKSEEAYEIAVHTARNREKGRSIEGDADSALFRYRALARDQVFAGAIVVDDGIDAAAVEALLADRSLLLGGSQNAGYGLTRVTGVEQPAAWREVEGEAQDIAAGDTFIVYLSSHAILHDPDTGQPTTDICRFLPGTIDKSFAAAGWVGGFNKQRGLPLSQQWAAQMGSTWVIKARTAIIAGQIRDLEERGIGARTEEGFGRLIINPQWPQEPFKFREDDSEAKPQEESTGTDEKLSPTVPLHPLLTKMNERLARAELDRRLAVAVNKMAGMRRGHLSRSQLGRLQVRIRRAADDRNFDDFAAYLEGTRKRKSADDQFRKFTVDGRNFRDRLVGLAANPQTVWDEFVPAEPDPPYWPPTTIGSAPFDYRTAELAHDYTVRFIANLCRQLSKLEADQ